MHTAIALAALATLAPGLAYAAPGDAEIQSKLDVCAAKTEAVSRLGCFDDAFNPGTPRSSAAATPPSPTPPAPRASGEPNLSIPDNQQGWLQRSGTSPMDRSPIEVALLPATQVNMSRMVRGMPQHAAIVIRCREHQTDFYVAFSDIVDGMEPPIRVSYRIGTNGTPQTTPWQISQDRQSYGFWHTPQTIPLLQQLAAADELFVRSDAGAMGTAEATFKLAGMEQALQPVRQACGW